MKAYLGIGSNLDQPQTQVKEAMRRLALVSGIDVICASSLYRTAPWGDEDQGDFINVVVQVEAALGPIKLLREVQAIENRMGRRRNGRRWGPRVIDIDILMYGQLRYRSVDLEVPHPRMHERAFVLIPLLEIDSGASIPSLGSAARLLSNVPQSGVCRLA